MHETIRTAAISPLRRRMIDGMNVRRFSRESRRNCVRGDGGGVTDSKADVDAGVASAERDEVSR